MYRNEKEGASALPLQLPPNDFHNQCTELLVQCSCTLIIDMPKPSRHPRNGKDYSKSGKGGKSSKGKRREGQSGYGGYGRYGWDPYNWKLRIWRCFAASRSKRVSIWLDMAWRFAKCAKHFLSFSHICQIRRFGFAASEADPTLQTSATMRIFSIKSSLRSPWFS